MSHHQHQSARAVPIREAAMFAGFALALISAAAGVFSNHTLLGISSAEAANGGAVFSRSTYSSPIALSANNTLVWSVNPGDDSVSVIRTSDNTKIKNIKVGDEPQSVALDPGNEYAYVANAAGSNVTVIKIKNANPSAFDAEVNVKSGNRGALTTGAEPWDIVTSPDGKRVFVANSGQDTITVIDAKKQKIIGHVDIRNSLCNDPDRNRRFQPRALAVTLDNTKLYVTRFFSFVKVGGKQGVDNGRGIGFSPPSLLGIGLLPPYYHNGACETLACVLQNANHRTAAGAFPFGDILADANKRAKVVRFLESIDVKTSPITR